MDRHYPSRDHTPYGPEEHNSLDTVLSRFPHQQEGLAPEAQESLDFLASLGPDEVAPTGYQTVDNAHDNQIENKASELEEEHEDGQDAEL